MTTKLYDHEFAPFTIDGDRRIVASEDGWQRVRAFAREIGAARIRVPVDVFEDWRGPMVDAAERVMFDCCSCHYWWSADMADYDPTKRDIRPICQKCKSPGPNEMTMADVRRRLFALIDDYPGVTWMLETSHPENVSAMMLCPRELEYGSEFHGKVICFHCGSGKTRPNLWLYAKADSQSEADARIPHLLRCPAAVRGLAMTPILGTISLECSCFSPTWNRLYPDERIHHVIIRGGDEPMHPDWVRSIIRQCDAAGVPVWFDGWGEWLPWRSECMNESQLSFAGFPMKRFSKKSGFVTESRNFDSAAEKDRFLFDECVNMVRVGAAHSGCVIDGRKVKQLPKGGAS